MKKAVIIGAGQTGRGFIAPIAENNGYELVFLDKKKELVEQLNREGFYRVEYFGNVRDPRIIRDYKAFYIEEEEAVRQIAESDAVFVSVFASHIGELTGCLEKAAALRKGGKLTIICCENGVNVKKPLIDAGLDAVISEGIIFCTTLQPDMEKLDLVSQDYPELPVDGKVEGFGLKLEGMPLEQDFPSLIQRKIYTYNFISAVVAYLGSYKGYEVYGEAANDGEIVHVISGIVPVASRVIAKQYHVPYETQLTFTNNAVAKFRNREIYDTIYRNARQAERKLGASERILTPLRLAHDYEDDMGGIELVAASAIYYGSEKEKMDVDAIIERLKETVQEESCVQNVQKMLEMFRRGTLLSEIIAFAEHE